MFRVGSVSPRASLAVLAGAAISLAAYVAFAAAGRTLPHQLSLRAVGAAGAAFLLLGVWVGLLWAALALAGAPPRDRVRALGPSFAPLVLLVVPVLTVYVSDGANHLLTRYGEHKIAPLLFVGMATLAVQAWVIGREVRHGVGVSTPSGAAAAPLRAELPVAVPLLLGLFAVYVFTSNGHLRIVDEQFNYAVAKHIVDRGSIEAGIQGERYSKYGPVMPALLAPLYAWDKLLGHPLPPGDPQIHWSWLYADEGGPYPPLPVLLYSPAWTALAATLLYLLARAAGAGRGASLATALIYGLSTVAWVYAKTLYSNPTANALLLGTILALAVQAGRGAGEQGSGGDAGTQGHGDAGTQRRRPSLGSLRLRVSVSLRLRVPASLCPCVPVSLRSPAPSPQPPTPGPLPAAVAGILFGLAVATRYDFAAFGPALAWYAWRTGAEGTEGAEGTRGDEGARGPGEVRRATSPGSLSSPSSLSSRSLRLLAFGAATATVVLPLVAGLNYVKYGNSLDFGYRGGEQGAAIYLEAPLANMYGLLFSFGFGLFPSNPLLLMALAAYPALRRQQPAFARLCLTLFLIAIPLYGSYTGWAGGRNYGPRYLLTVAPFLLLMASAQMAAWWRSWGSRLLCGACIAWGFVYAAAGVVVSYALGFMSIHLEQAGYARQLGITLSDETIWWDARFSPVAAQLRLFWSWLRQGDYFFAPLAVPSANFPGPGGLDFYLYQQFRGPVLRPLLLVGFAAFVLWQAYLIAQALGTGDWGLGSGRLRSALTPGRRGASRAPRPRTAELRQRLEHSVQPSAASGSRPRPLPQGPEQGQ